ncbi:hypothetical protein DPMN_082486 [Dreissena polymorpha]|uniref:Uncharacterized protein n=1 Tax=Dreissena polymorpha TaxID=45954 RepID=A0A9D3Y711_DREPO|nr:hypothetical protein DPMN_082486 [Dreissena polymorpha]
MPVSPMFLPVPSYDSMYGNIILPLSQHSTFVYYPWVQTGALSPSNNNNNNNPCILACRRLTSQRPCCRRRISGKFP